MPVLAHTVPIDHNGTDLLGRTHPSVLHLISKLGKDGVEICMLIGELLLVQGSANMVGHGSLPSGPGSHSALVLLQVSGRQDRDLMKACRSQQAANIAVQIALSQGISFGVDIVKFALCLGRVGEIDRALSMEFGRHICSRGRQRACL